MASALCSWAERMITSPGCLIPRFTTLYPLLDKMMSTKFFPISWTSPWTTPITTLRLKPVRCVLM